MVKILINLSDEEDKIVEVYKVVNSLKTKQEAVKGMVQHFKVSITPTNLGKNDEYYRKTLKF
jgi:hypothetical protein